MTAVREVAQHNFHVSETSPIIQSCSNVLIRISYNHNTVFTQTNFLYYSLGLEVWSS